MPDRHKTAGPGRNSLCNKTGNFGLVAGIEWSTACILLIFPAREEGVPRPRTNDPLGVSDNPVVVTDPVRQAELVAEFRRRLAYLERSFLSASAYLGDSKAFNASLARLQRALRRRKPASIRGDRVHPEIEIVISHHARKFAKERLRSEDARVEYQDVRRAAEDAVTALSPRVGRPKAEILCQHVEGVMALIQQSLGKPLRASRSRDSIYDLHFVDKPGQIIVDFFQRLDPRVTETQLVNIVIKARKKYAGRRMSFLEMFPGYGSTIDERGEPKLRPGLRLEHFEPTIPIYCP